MRRINTHKTNAANDTITIEVLDEPGAGGANHAYVVSGFDLGRNPSNSGTGPGEIGIIFQNGPIAEAGKNGITQEVLLAIVIDRLRSFQAGQYSCRENAIALTHIETGLMWLQSRTRERMARGVEGTNQK